MALDKNSISRGLLVAGGLALGLVMAVSVTTNPAGGLAALVPLITVSLSILAFAKPRAGLFALVPLVIWVDEFKRLAVYYGGAYSTTVLQTLAMPFVLLAALNLGFILNVLFRKVRMEPVMILFFGIAGVVGVGIFLATDGPLAERGQRAANLGGYLTLIPIAYAYLRSPDEWRRFFAIQVLFALPAAAWGIKQYYFGFDQIEWEYARSGLSQVHSGQMLMALDPRVFGFFGSASALGCVGIYCSFAWWHALRVPKQRLLWFATAAILSWVVVISTQRTTLVYPLVVLVCAWCFRTQLRTFALVSLALGTFLAGVFASEYMVNEGLESINRVISNDSRWGGQVLRVSTFSDRLVGWQRLTRSESWSLFGTEEVKQSGIFNAKIAGTSDDNHDIINKVLMGYGAVGLAVVLILTGCVLWVLIRVPRSAPDWQSRNDAAFALALALPAVGLSFIAGDNFNTNPINMQIWTCFSGVLVSRRAFLARSREVVPSGASLGGRGNVPPPSTSVLVSRPSGSN